MQHLKELQKHFISILLLVLIGLNSFHIAKNSYYIERNAEAILGNVTVLNVHSYCINVLAKELKKLRRTNINNTEQLTTIISAIKEIIEIQTEKIEILYKHTNKLTNRINQIELKPSYIYLKSVTVFMEAKQKDFVDDLVDKVSEIAPDLLEKIDYDKIQPDWLGTGVIVKIDEEYTYILTNKHVAGGLLPDNEDGSKVLLMVSDIQRNRQRAELIQFHPTEDLALIRIKGKINNKKAIKGVVYPNIAEKVYTVGQSLGRPYTYGEGVFSATIIPHDVYELPTIGGCSGSGIFNKNGELIGMIYSVSIAYPNIYDLPHANSVKAIYIKQFLQENNILFAN